MKKLTKLLVLSGLAVSLLTGCTINGKGGKGDEPEQPEVVKTLQSIKVSAQPTKTSYRQGEDFDAAGLEVKAVYNTGEEVLAATAYTLSGFDSSTAGPKTVTVTFEGKTATFEVNVIGKDGLSITAPAKEHYVVGDELDLTGLVVAQKYADDGTPVILNENEYTVSGFSSEEAGPVTVTITVGEQTATFTVEVFAADWSDEEKEEMDYYIGYNMLLYRIPYYKGFEFGDSGIETPAGDGAYWFTATTSYEVSDDEFEEYVDYVGGLEIDVPVLDENDEPVLDDEGNPTYTKQKAWSLYRTSNGTSDIPYLGFGEGSPVIQLARWYNDNTSYFAYQIMSIGLDADGKLLVVTTVAQNVFAGYGIGAGYGWPCVIDDEGSPYDMVQGDLSALFEYGCMLTFEPTSLSAFPYGSIKYPSYSADTTVYVISDSYLNPYIYGNVISDFYDATRITYSFENETAFTQADLDAIKDAYATDGITPVEPAEPDGTFYVKLEQDGYTVYVDYSFDSNYDSIDMKFEIYYEVPFRSDFVISTILDELNAKQYALYTSSGFVPLSDNIAKIINYDETAGSARLLTPIFAKGFNDLATLKADLFASIAKSGWTVADLYTWEDTYTVAGTLKLGTAEAADVTLELEEEDEDYVSFSFSYSDIDYIGMYDKASGALAILIDNGSTPSILANFAAREGATDYTGEWNNGKTGEDAVVLTIDAAGFEFSFSIAVLLLEDSEHNGVVANLMIGVALDYYIVSLTAFDKVKVSSSNWADARALAQEQIEGMGATDTLPEQLAHDLNAEFYVFNNWDESIDVYFETAADAAASDLGADLVAGGFAKGLTINGQTVYASENEQFYLAVDEADGELVRVHFLGDTDETFTLAYNALGAAKYFFDLADFRDADGLVGLESLNTEEKKDDNQIVATFAYADAEKAAAGKTAVIATLGSDFVLDENTESETYGLYVDTTGDTVKIEVVENAVVVTFTFAV